MLLLLCCPVASQYTFMLHFSKDGKSVLLVPFCSLFWSQPVPNSQACGHQARTTETPCQGQVTDRPGHMLVKSTGQNDSLSAQHLEPDCGVRTSNLCSLCLSRTIMSSHGHRLDLLELPAWEKFKEIRFPECLRVSW